MGTEGAENSHPHLCVIFDSLERRYLSIFQDRHLSQIKKKSILSETPNYGGRYGVGQLQGPECFPW